MFPLRNGVFTMLILLGSAAAAGAEKYPERFVWAFGWNLNRDRDVADISPILQTASRYGLNGAVLSAGLDTLCRKPPKQVEILRRHMPGVEIYIWSDMLDPHHNAHADYYLVRGDFTGSWRQVPRDLKIAVWGGAPREESLQFFAREGFRTLVACDYDAEDLDEVQGWLRAAALLSNVGGFMYTPWQKKYDLLAKFSQLLQTP